MNENVITCDYSVPLTVRVDIKTEEVLEVWLHLESFQSSPPGRFRKVGGEQEVWFRDAFTEYGEFCDGENIIADRALAIADRVRITNPEFPLQFTVDEEKEKESPLTK